MKKAQWMLSASLLVVVSILLVTGCAKKKNEEYEPPAELLAALYSCDPGDADVASSATIGEGVTLCDGARVKQRASIGDFALVGEDATVEKDAIVGEHAVIGDGATVKKNAIVGAYAVVGAGADIQKDVTIGDGASIGADARVDAGLEIPPNATVPEGARVQDQDEADALCRPSTVALRANEVVDGSLWLADPAPPSWEASVSARGMIKVCIFGRIIAATNVWEQLSVGPCELVPPQIRVDAKPKGGPVQTSAGDSITLVYSVDDPDELLDIEILFPELQGIKSARLYPAQDGSTYFDEALTELAVNACNYR